MHGATPVTPLQETEYSGAWDPVRRHGLQLLAVAKERTQSNPVQCGIKLLMQAWQVEVKRNERFVRSGTGHVAGTRNIYTEWELN